MDKGCKVKGEVYASEAEVAPYTIKSLIVMPYANGFSVRVKGLAVAAENDFETKIGAIEDVIKYVIGRMIKELREATKQQDIVGIAAYKGVPYPLTKDGFAKVLALEIGNPKLPRNNMHSLDEFVNIGIIELLK